MARKITVVVSQSSSPLAGRRHLEEDLAVRLLLHGGLDTSFIPHLEDLTAGSTGQLCLEGIGGDLVLLSWLSPTEAQEALQRLGIQGRAGRTNLSGQALAAGPADAGHRRAIYHLDLRAHGVAEPYLAEIRRIQAEASVQTVNLLGGLLGGGPAVVQAALRIEPGVQEAAAEAPRLVARSQTPGPSNPSSLHGPSPSPPLPEAGRGEESVESLSALRPLTPDPSPRNGARGETLEMELDALMDALDQSEL